MGRQCTVCAHDARDDIDEALVSGDSQRAVAERHGLNRKSVGRHARSHLPATLAAVHEQRELDRGASLLERIEHLYEQARKVLDQAEKDRRANVSLAALRELRGIVELLGKATGELREQPATVVNLIASPEWVALRAAVFEELAPHPDIRARISGRLLELEAGR